MAPNTAAWLTAEKAHPFEIKEAPEWTPADDEILVKVGALAINPVDGYVQAQAFFPMKYPTILGQDVAGEVTAVGRLVQRFAQGDRVLGQVPGMVTGELRECAFQSYVTMKEHMASEIPDNVFLEEACTLPAGVSTSSCGLFQDAPFLGMQYPTEPARQPNGKTVLIWGGASSVGSCAIQLSKAAGYEVLTTASPKNFEYTKKLGADQVFDYNEPNVVEEITKACEGKDLIGALDCIGPPALLACQQIVHKAKGIQTVATVKHPPKETLEGVTVQRILGVTLKDNAVGAAVYRDYLPKALKSGSFVPAPKPQIVGKGLESIQEGVDLIQKGVSAKKLVVSL